jgi:hypothetical protein
VAEETAPEVSESAFVSGSVPLAELALFFLRLGTTAFGVLPRTSP